MESQRLDIVELIELNPITRLSKDYQGKFIEKVQQNFTESQQQIFIASFYTYLNYNSETDFVIDLENIWNWLGFGRKDFCKRVLTKHFIKNVDYKIFIKEKSASQVVESGIKNKGGAGLNKEKILMNINTFKLLCLKSNTKKADEIHKYFIKLENLTLETITEESTELKLQLQNQKTSFIKEKQQILLDSYDKKCIVYIIKIRENMYKFGNTDNIKRRLCEHNREINSNIELIYCLESKNNVKVENDLKEYLKTTKLRKEEKFNNKNQTELIETNDIKMIQNELEKFNKPINEYVQILKKEIIKLKNENEELKRHYNPEDLNTSESEENQEELNEQDESDSENDPEELNEQDESDSENDPEKLNESGSESESEDNTEELNQDELQIKIKRYQKRNEYLRLYRKGEKYQKKITSEPARKKERERYQKRKTTAQYKKTRLDYNQKNKLQIKQRETNLRKRKSKTAFVSSDDEKNKFKDWLDLNIIQKNKENLNWFLLLDKYIGYRTSPLISTIYKKYFIEHVTDKFTDVKTKYKKSCYINFALIE
jgi:predicted GIY-YIG superfamily endonuclease